MAVVVKALILLAIVVAALYLLRGRRKPSAPADGAPKRPPAAGQPSAMVACAHCGVHLPGDDAVTDEAGRSFCSEAHRLAGPR